MEFLVFVLVMFLSGFGSFFSDAFEAINGFLTSLITP